MPAVLVQQAFHLISYKSIYYGAVLKIVRFLLYLQVIKFKGLWRIRIS